MARSGAALDLERSPKEAERLRFEIVIPTLGRPSLVELLKDIAREEGPRPERIILVDDRPEPEGDLLMGPIPFELEPLLRVLPGRALGPAAARNAGWRAGGAPWVVFLDDDVRLERAWATKLVRDLERAPPDVAGVQGRIRVPMPRYRAPTEHERLAKEREHAQWSATDIAYRRSALELVGGFDERFTRPSREDIDLGLRVIDSGFQIVQGHRLVEHPAPEEGSWDCLTRERRVADDVLMRAIHGPRWRERSGAIPDERARHLATALAGVGLVMGAAAGAWPFALGCAAIWGLSTATLAWKRIAPGPRTVDEMLTGSATSALVPLAASWHWLRGVTGTVLGSTEPHRAPRALPERPIRAVIVDRDGTLIEDHPYEGDPTSVRPRPKAREALDRLRAAGIPVVVIADQGPPARGLLREDLMDELNERVEALLGPFDGWFVCAHHADEGCLCRRPAATLVLEAAEHVGVAPEECLVVGDESTDVLTAQAAGARSLLVPTPQTRCDEVWGAEEVAADLDAAAERVLQRRPFRLREVTR